MKLLYFLFFLFLFLSTGLDCLSRHMHRIVNMQQHLYRIVNMQQHLYRIVNMQQHLKFFSQDKSFEWGLHFFPSYTHWPSDVPHDKANRSRKKYIYTLAADPGKGRGAHRQIFRPSWASKDVENRFESSFNLLTLNSENWLAYSVSFLYPIHCPSDRWWE